MVADDDGRGELLLLDQQLLTGSADTHTHTHTHRERRGDRETTRPTSETERNFSGVGSGCAADRSSVHGVLAVALPDKSTGLESASIEAIRPESAGVRREFNPDGRVADFVNGEEALRFMMNEVI